MKPEQCRQARELLGWSAVRLASRAGVCDTLVRHYEKRRKVPTKLAAIRDALEAAGVEFIAEDGSVPGVRLRKS